MRDVWRYGFEQGGRGVSHEKTLLEFFEECERFDPREMPAIRHALSEIVRERDVEQARVTELEALVVELKESCPSWYLSNEAIATLATFPGEQND
jgi:hypothetical protein